MVAMTWGRFPPVVGSWLVVSPALTTETSPSSCCWGRVRRSRLMLRAQFRARVGPGLSAGTGGWLLLSKFSVGWPGLVLVLGVVVRGLVAVFMTVVR